MASLYHVISGEKRDTLDVRNLGEVPVGGGFRNIVPLRAGGQDALLAFDANGQCTAFRALPAAPWIEPVACEIRLGGPADIVEPFVIGLNPHLLAYAAEAGTLSFIPIGDDLKARPPYVFSRKRAPITTGFTVVKPLVFNGLVSVLCYSFTTGEVDIFSLNVTATLMSGAKPGTPPLLMRPLWIHQWAKNWTRFAFFTLGLENFFFKINVGKVNVNIDHIMDDPGTGTVEVGTYLQDQLDDPKGVEIVASFSMKGGEPYFVAYRKNGQTGFYRIHSDCQGWTREAELDAGGGVTQIIPYETGGERFQLFY